MAEQPVVVASAMGGVTDVLLQTAQLAVQREIDQVGKNIDALRERHLQVAPGARPAGGPPQRADRTAIPFSSMSC